MIMKTTFVLNFINSVIHGILTKVFNPKNNKKYEIMINHETKTD